MSETRPLTLQASGHRGELSRDDVHQKARLEGSRAGLFGRCARSLVRAEIERGGRIERPLCERVTTYLSAVLVSARIVKRQENFARHPTRNRCKGFQK